MTLELEINAATRAFLPEGALEVATPLRRVELKLPSDESKVIIGQVLPTELHAYTGKPASGQAYHEYTLLIYRYESSDVDTNFIAGREDTPTTYEEACELNWEDEFPGILSSHEKLFWPPTCANGAFYILFGRGNRGIIFRTNKKRLGIEFLLPDNTEKTLFQLSSGELDQFVTNLYADTNSGFRQAVDWMVLSEEQKQEIAFACENGSWNELRKLIEKVFQVIIGAQEILPEGEYIWHFLYPSKPFARRNVEAIDVKQILLDWRIVLINHFQPKYIDEQRIKKNIPLYLDGYLSRCDQGRIHLNKPTQHEVVEAGFQLAIWANENLSAEAAKRLLDF